MDAMTDDRSQSEMLAQVARTDLIWSEAVAEQEILDCGLAIFNADYPQLAEVNQVREVALEGKVSISPQQAWDEVAAFFDARSLSPLRWSTSVRLMGGELGEFLAGKGYARRTAVAMIRDANVRTEIDESIQLLPGRAAPQGFAALMAERFATDPRRDARLALAREHLADTRLEMLIARVDDQPAGCAGVLTVGDVGRVRGLYVAEAFADRREWIASTLMGHILELGYRYQFSTLCGLVESDDASRIEFYRACGFAPVGELEYFQKDANG